MKKLFALLSLMFLGACGKMPGFHVDNVKFQEAKPVVNDLLPNSSETKKSLKGDVIRGQPGKISFLPHKREWSADNKSLMVVASLTIDGNSFDNVEFNGVKEGSKIVLETSKPEIKDKVKVRIKCLEDTGCEDYYIDVMYNQDDVIYVTQFFPLVPEPTSDVKTDVNSGRGSNSSVSGSSNKSGGTAPGAKVSSPSQLPNDDEFAVYVDEKETRLSGYQGPSDSEVRKIMNVKREKKAAKGSQDDSKKRANEVTSQGHSDSSNPESTQRTQSEKSNDPGAKSDKAKQESDDTKKNSEAAKSGDDKKNPAKKEESAGGTVKYPTVSGSVRTESSEDENDDDIEGDPDSSRSGDSQVRDLIFDLPEGLRSLLIKYKAEDQSIRYPMGVRLKDGRWSYGAIRKSTDLRQVSQIPNVGFVVSGLSESPYSSFNMIKMISYLGQKLRINHPDKVLQVSSASRINGGPRFNIAGSRSLIRNPQTSSHQNGTDVDIRYLRQVDSPEKGGESVVSSDNRVTQNFLIKDQWELFKQAFSTGSVEIIGVDQAVKKAICEHVIRQGEYRRGDSDTQVAKYLKRLLPIPGHKNHFHLRISCGTNNQDCQSISYRKYAVGCGY